MDDKGFLLWLANNLEAPQFGDNTKGRLRAIADRLPAGTESKPSEANRKAQIQNMKRK